MNSAPTVADLYAEYMRLEGEASTEQQRFAFSARPDFARIAEAGRKANQARILWMNAKQEADRGY